MIALFPIAVAAPAPEEEVEDYRSHVDQARFFLRKEWYDDARDQLELAVASEDGRLDPEAWFMLAKVSYELGDLSRARYAADRALVNSRDAEQIRQTDELLQFFEERFGLVTVEAPHDGMASRVDIELRSTIFDPDLKLWLNRVQATLDRPVVLPYTVGLPAGRYLVNGVEVEVAAGSETTVSPPIRSRSPRTLQVVEVELGLGATALIGRPVANLLPAPTAELSIGLPIGPLVVGAMADLSPQPYTTRVGALQAGPQGFAGGAQVGFELPGTQPLVVRPSLAWRYVSLPGFEAACARGATWTCAVDAPVRQLYLYVPTTAHAAAVELAVMYQDRARRSGLGAGAKASGELWFGRLPAAGEASGELGPVSYEVPDAAGSFTAGGVRILATLSYAL